MMQLAIDRSRQTGGSFAASTVIHVLALLLLTFLAGREAIEHLQGDELTEIAYIEARYGEDVAQKVKLKKLDPGPPGRGITTDSAVKKPEPAVAALPEPEALPQIEPVLQQKELPPAPRLEPQRLEPQRTELAAATVPDIAPVTTPRQDLVQASQLEAKIAPAPTRQVIDTSKLEDSLAGKVKETETTVPRPARPKNRDAFKPTSGGLRDRGGRATASADPVVAAAGTTRRRGGVTEAPANLGGGALQAKTPSAGAYQAPRSGLAPANTARAGMLDVAAPTSGGGGGAKSGRKTILDYGSGSGGGGGGLVGRRGRIAEVSSSKSIVADAEVEAEPQPRVQEADTKLTDKGVGMTISGQIAGRKILTRAPAEYTDRARREGWEGVVAVHFTVLPDGRVKDNVYFDQTSVHRDLNQAAMKAIRKFKFAPLPASQGSVEQWGVITIVFRLN